MRANSFCGESLAADRLIDPPFGTSNNAPDPIIDLILSCNTQKNNGRTRKKGGGERAGDAGGENNKLNRRRKFDESTDSLGVQ